MSWSTGIIDNTRGRQSNFVKSLVFSVSLGRVFINSLVGGGKYVRVKKFSTSKRGVQKPRTFKRNVGQNSVDHQISPLSPSPLPQGRSQGAGADYPANRKKILGNQPQNRENWDENETTQHCSWKLWSSMFNLFMYVRRVVSPHFSQAFHRLLVLVLLVIYHIL